MQIKCERKRFLAPYWDVRGGWQQKLECFRKGKVLGPVSKSHYYVGRKRCEMALAKSASPVAREETSSISNLQAVTDLASGDE